VGDSCRASCTRDYRRSGNEWAAVELPGCWPLLGFWSPLLPAVPFRAPSSGTLCRSASRRDHCRLVQICESELLAEIYSEALDGGGFHVRRVFGLGPREFVAPALTRGLVELVPEYAGTALEFLSLGRV
jgi:hypothetical protein